MKYVTLFKSIYTYIKNSLISFFTFIIIKFLKKRDILELFDLLKNKKVLVLGTGPSLNNLNQDLIDSYEVIFFLNNAISVSKIFNFNHKIKIFFNFDLFIFKEFKKEIYSLDENWKFIFIPIHLQLFFSFLKFYFKKKVFLLIPKYRIGSPFEKNVTKSFITYELAKNQDAKNILSLSNFRAFPHTVALNAFYFLISAKVSQLHYLGCDFSAGKSLFTDYKGAGNLTKRKFIFG